MAHSTKPNWQPPKGAEKFLSWFCKNELLEEIRGDLFEFYQMERREKSAFKANISYWYHMVHFLRPFAIKQINQNSNSASMYRNYFKLAYRNLWRNKFYSFLNIIGLALGIASCILITIYVKDELSFDKHHKDHNRIYRVITDLKFGDRAIHGPIVPNLLSAYAKEHIPNIEESARFTGSGFTTVVNVGEQQFRQENVTFAHTDLFKVFTIPFIAGDKETALDDPKTVVISEDVAQKLFNTTDVIGKEIAFNRDIFVITGVIENMPEKSHFKFDLMMSIGYQDTRFESTWTSINSYTYFKVKEQTNIGEMEAQLTAYMHKFMAPLIEDQYGFAISDIANSEHYSRFYLQPLTDIHLKSHFPSEIRANGDITNIYIFSLIGLGILIIACINFVNLSTARASRRSKEVGLRKVVGSVKSQLIQQFLTESVFYTFLSFVFAIGIVYLVLPFFNELTDKEITHPFPGIWPYLILAIFLIGLLAGLYPAFVLSAFKPVSVLKGDVIQRKSNGLRGVLVVFQFAASILVIVGAVVIHQQLIFIQQKELGYARDELLTIKAMDISLYGAQSEALKEGFLSKAFVKSMSITEYVPVDGRRDNEFLSVADNGNLDSEINMQFWPIDYDYLHTMGMQILEGRAFLASFKSDSNAIILNETGVKSLGLKSPLGKKIKQSRGGKIFTIVGVVKDFHYASFKEKIQPLAFYLGNNPWYVSLRYSKDTKPTEVIKHIESVWNQYAGGQPFVYDFVQDKYKALYQNEVKMGTIINILAGFAIFVACLGLFGLAAFMAERRKKEIAIRKVLGAHTFELAMLLLGNFTRLVLIASVIALPIAFFLAKGWLEAFAYRIQLGWAIFFIVFMSVLFTSWLTITYQSLHASMQNPVDHLRSE